MTNIGAVSSSRVEEEYTGIEHIPSSLRLRLRLLWRGCNWGPLDGGEVHWGITDQVSGVTIPLGQ